MSHPTGREPQDAGDPSLHALPGCQTMQGGLVMLASRWHRSRDSQRSEGACGPDRHRQREQDRDSRTASEANRPAGDTSDCSPATLRHLTGDLLATFNLRSLLCPEFGSSLLRDLVAASEGDAAGSQPQSYAVPSTVAEKWRLDHSFAELSTARALPLEVVHGLLLRVCRLGVLESFADALKPLSNETQAIGEDFECVFKTRDVGRRVVAHAAHDTWRAA